MAIKFIKSAVNIGYSYFKGAVAELSTETETELIKKGYAESVVSTGSESLPEDFPARDTLIELGLTTIEQVKAVEDLTELEGIGKVTAEKINDYLVANE